MRLSAYYSIIISSTFWLINFQVWQFMRTDSSHLMVRTEDMPHGTPQPLKLAIKHSTGARSSKRDFLSKLPSSDEEAAGWRKVNMLILATLHNNLLCSYNIGHAP